MGLAASQCRLLVLTARKSDLEFRAQNITNRKLLLSGQTQNIATTYSDKLNNYITEFTYDIDKNGNAQTLNETLTVDSIYAQNSNLIGTYRVKLADGRIAVSDKSQLPYAIASSKGRSVASASELYSALSNQEKLGYMTEAVKNLISANNTTVLPESTQALLNQKIVKADIKDSSGKVIAPKNSQVVDRRTALNSLLTGLYQKAGVSALYDSSKTTPEINKFSKVNAVKEFTKDQLTAIRNIMTQEPMASKLATNYADYYKDVCSKEASYTLVAADKLAAGTEVDPSKLTDAQMKMYAAAVYALNDYLMNHPTTSSGTPELDQDVILTNDYSLIAKPESFVTDHATSISTIGDLLEESYDTIQTEARDSDAAKDAYAVIYSVMESMGESMLGFLQQYSNFGSYVQAQTQGMPVDSELMQVSDNEIYCRTTGETFVILPGLKNYKSFQNALQTGALYLEQRNKENTGWDPVLTGGNSVIKDRLYTEDDQAAEAEYETQTAIIQRQDKMLDVELKQIETQQKACDNEIDSVKKILDKNVERSFKVFS